MNFYDVLGVDPTSTLDEIKAAYRKLAALHHPDRGGNTETFQNIAIAYDMLRSYHTSQQDNWLAEDDLTAAFSNHFPNKDLHIKVPITFAQSYTGVEISAVYFTRSGQEEIVHIKVPPGIRHGQIIKYPNLGECVDSTLPRGSLFATFSVDFLANYERDGNDLIVYQEINPIEAMIGCIKSVRNLDGTHVDIKFNPGVQHGSKYKVKGLGFVSQKQSTGDLVVIAVINIPAVTNLKLKQHLESILQEILNKPITK